MSELDVKSAALGDELHWVISTFVISFGKQDFLIEQSETQMSEGSIVQLQSDNKLLVRTPNPACRIAPMPFVPSSPISFSKTVNVLLKLRRAADLRANSCGGFGFTKPQSLALMADTTQAALAAKNAIPAPGANNSSAANRDHCIFCRVVDGKDSKTTSDKILYQDDEFVVFPNIHPSAKHHLLVVTKEHIKDAKALNTSQIGLLDRLVQTGQKVLIDVVNKEASNVDVGPEKILMGFHWPPFHTVSHIHLHVISPSDQIGFIGRLIFRPNSYWFVQPEWVRSRLQKMKDEGK